MEKNELIRQHTLETADLRERNNMLGKMLDNLQNQPRQQLGEDFTANDFGFGFHMSTTISEEEEKSFPLQKSEYPFSWNTFYMCLLFGAFIASNSSSSSLLSRPLPHLSEKYRSESANVLKAVFSSYPQDLTPSAHQPTLSMANDAAEMSTTLGGVMSSSTTLDELHALTMPTKEQEHEQAFTLTPDQDNSLTTFDESVTDGGPAPPSNLRQVYNAMRNDVAAAQKSSSSSDVHSRSLMWDHVPEKVIHDFRRMVEEYGESPAAVVKKEAIN